MTEIRLSSGHLNLTVDYEVGENVKRSILLYRIRLREELAVEADLGILEILPTQELPCLHNTIKKQQNL